MPGRKNPSSHDNEDLRDFRRFQARLRGEGVGLVKRVKDGRQVRYFAGPAWAELNVQITPSGADTPAET